MARLTAKHTFLTLAIVLQGCRFDAVLATSRLGCDDGVCPEGLTCGADHLCHAPERPDASAIGIVIDGGVDAGGFADGSSMVLGADAAPVAGPCGKISLLADDFSSTT